MLFVARNASVDKHAAIHASGRERVKEGRGKGAQSVREGVLERVCAILVARNTCVDKHAATHKGHVGGRARKREKGREGERGRDRERKVG